MQDKSEKELPPPEKIITLAKPIEFGGQKYDELKLREPSAGDVKESMAYPNIMESNIRLVSLVAGVPRQVVERIGISVITEATEYLAGFMPTAPLIGPTS